MMQIPSSNHSTGTSRASNTSHRKASLVSWLDGFIDKACCAASGYTDADILDDNSIAYSEDANTAGNNENHHYQAACTGPRTSCMPREDDSILWDEADNTIPWRMEEKQGNASEYRNDFADSRTPTKKSQPPLSPGSVATATTVLTGSSSYSSRGSTPRSPPPKPASSKISERAHSTGNFRRPEEVWQQQEEEQRRIQIQQQAERRFKKQSRAPREVLIPMDWTHEHGLRRIRSDTLPKLPFQTVQRTQGYHRPKN